MASRIRMVGLLVAVIIASPSQAEDRPSGFVVIVNSQNPIVSLERKFLADVFFKKVTQWPEDGSIQPVDLRPDSPARRRFSQEVLRRSVNGVKSYWQQLIFSGRDVPPPELVSDAEVIRYVVKYPGSIGYVSGDSLAAGSAANGIKMVSIK
ncbi:MAG: hypothetical protein AB7P04_13615 [Bacteriovoracia bacterium]